MRSGFGRGDSLESPLLVGRLLTPRQMLSPAREHHIADSRLQHNRWNDVEDTGSVPVCADFCRQIDESPRKHALEYFRPRIFFVPPAITEPPECELGIGPNCRLKAAPLVYWMVICTGFAAIPSDTSCTLTFPLPASDEGIRTST